MAIKVTEINHVQATVPGSAEQEAKHFYGAILGLEEIPKPAGPRSPLSQKGSQRGAWYRCGSTELHLSIEDISTDNHASRRHVCFMVANLADAEARMRDAGIE